MNKHSATQYVEHGFALVSIPHGKKGPKKKGWNRRENAITTPKAAAKLNGHNIGLLHEWSATCAIDIDNLKRARAFLSKESIDLSDLLIASDAVQIVSGKQNRAKLIYRLPKRVSPLPHRKLADGALELRCAGVQDVLPPSIHPETGKPYTWRGNWRKLPKLPRSVLSLWRKKGGNDSSKPALATDGVVRALKKCGLYREDAGGGKHLITCPWSEDHTTSGGQGETAYFMPHTNGFDKPAFKCFHAHCADRAIEDLCAFLGLQLPPGVSMRRVADIKARPIDWLWDERIARGKVTILAGHPGLGKSQFALSIAAIVSSGARWPVDRSVCTRGSVVILSAEDTAEDTIRPRLEAAGADLRHVHVIDAVRSTDRDGLPCEMPFDLGRDLAALDTSLDKLPDAALLIIDPITAYLGTTDSHKNAEVRGLLAPLSKLAEKQNVAIICITHLNKGGGGIHSGALMRVMGSLAFVAASRAAYVVVRDPEDHGRRLFLPAKNNLGTDETGFAFRIETRTVSDGIETSRVAWESARIEASVDEMLNTPSVPKQRDAAVDFLKGLLRDGSMPSAQVHKQAEAKGFAWKTVMRAKDQLGIQAVKSRTVHGSWSWMMPNSQKSTIEDGQSGYVGNVGQDGHLHLLRNKSKMAKKEKKEKAAKTYIDGNVRGRVKLKFPPSRRVRSKKS